MFKTQFHIITSKSLINKKYLKNIFHNSPRCIQESLFTQQQQKRKRQKVQSKNNNKIPHIASE